jgi:hypothetical protein
MRPMTTPVNTIIVLEGTLKGAAGTVAGFTTETSSTLPDSWMRTSWYLALSWE